jgi:hypothetical protein
MKKLLFALSVLILSGFATETSYESKTKSISEFKWDFSEQKKYIYSFSQEVKSEDKIGDSDLTDKSQSSAKGYLNVNIKENHLADLSLSGVEVNIVMFNRYGSPKDTSLQKVPVKIVQDMKADGSFAYTNKNILFDILLPLPKHNIKVGESDSIKLQIPFNVNGSQLFTKGQNTLTFKGYEKIKTRNCAVLEGRFDISELDIPKELNGNYTSSTIGGAKYYFDFEQGCYVGADIHLIMEVLMDLERGEEDTFSMFMSMKSDKIFKIRLEKIEPQIKNGK